jgi:hypothetical protein
MPGWTTDTREFGPLGQTALDSRNVWDGGSYARPIKSVADTER